jgi:anti-anti-sigma regulatory factor
VNDIVVVRLDAAAIVWADCPLRARLAPQLHNVLQTLIHGGATPLVVDLVAVSAVEDSAVAVLAAAATRAGSRGTCIELRLPGGRAATVRQATELRSAVSAAYPAAA